MKKTITMMAAFMAIVFTLCSFSGDNKGKLVGQWVMQYTDVFSQTDEKVGHDDAAGVWWEVTDSTVTVHDEGDFLDGIALPYTISDKVVKIEQLPFSFTVVELTDTKLVLRSSVFNDEYSVITFKRK